MEEYEIKIKEAIQLLINAVVKGQAHGAYTLEDSASILEAIKCLTTVHKKEEIKTVLTNKK